MRYDLIVVGGGPGGLMAAKTAAEDGLKVALIERKKNITEINRACLSAFYVHKVTTSIDVAEGETGADGYIDPVSVEILPGEKCRFHFPVPGFSLDYDGTLVPYYNWIELSPSLYQIHRHRPNHMIWAFYYQKEVLLASLLASALKAGAEIIPETIGMGAENIPDGVQIRVRGKSAERTLEARVAIAADGLASSIVESLGLNKDRKVMSPPYKILDYEMEGVETNLPRFSLLWITIPSVNPTENIGIGLKAYEKVSVFVMTTGTLSPGIVLERFMKYPTFAPWFRNARIVKKTAAGVGTGLRTPIKEPVAGNVVIVGDAGAPVETWIQGALACGYQSVKAIEKELNGQKGYSEYIDWWQKAFAFNDPEYFKRVGGHYPLPRICCDEELDYLYSLFQGRVGNSVGLVAQNLELIKDKKPELYEKLTKGMK
jgi:flavin-dependent dehydrogenase